MRVRVRVRVRGLLEQRVDAADDDEQHEAEAGQVEVALCAEHPALVLHRVRARARARVRVRVRVGLGFGFGLGLGSCSFWPRSWYSLASWYSS